MKGKPMDAGNEAVTLYRRDFEKGMVIVNPSKTDVACELSGEFFDVTQKDAANHPVKVTKLTIQGGDAVFLMTTH